MPRPKEYSRRVTFTSSADGEKLERIREICHIQKFEMNSLWDEKMDEVIEKYSQGLPIRNGVKTKTDVPTLLATMDEIKKWIMTQATPEEVAKAAAMMRSAAGWIKDSEKSIKLNYQLRQEGKIKLPPVS